MRNCKIDGCKRKHAAHGLCLMHYKRVKKHGSPDYKWGGKVIGRPCSYCERIAVAREMCWRHYQMWRNHGDALYADMKKKGGLPAGEHMRRGYRMVCVSKDIPIAVIADATVERTNAHATKQQTANHGIRGSGARRAWEHRKVASAKPGQIVHHIDGVPTNNSRENLHVFCDATGHGHAHRSLELIAYDLYRLGFVEFDRGIGRYKLAEPFVLTKK